MATPANVIGIQHLSYSSASAYLRCGRNWKFRYLDRIPAPTSPALLFGGVFHSTIEAYIRNVSKGGESAALTEIWERQWTSKLAQEADNVAWGDETPDALRAEGVRMLQTPEIARTIKGVTPLVSRNGHIHIEDFVELEVSGVPVPVVGYIDIIDSDGVPGDFKTASRAWSERAAQGELQPLFYLAALRQAGHSGNPEMRFRHYVFTKTRNPAAQVIETRRKPQEIEFLFELVREVWRGIEAGVFVPNPMTWKCSPKYCEYWAICRGAEPGLA